MRPESTAAVADALLCIDRLTSLVAAHPNLADADWIALSAVERQLITLGEALNRLKRFDRDRFDRVPAAPLAIGLRNVLVHGYDAIDSTKLVWS